MSENPFYIVSPLAGETGPKMTSRDREGVGENQEDLQLDLSFMLCPMPVIKLQNQIKKMAVNQNIKITCTDPGTLHDIPTWCRLHGHEVLEILRISEPDKKIIFYIQKIRP